MASDPVWQTPADRTEAVEESSGFAKAGNDYVQRVRGTFTAPADGAYVFAVASDDDGLLLASPSGDPAALAPVAGCGVWCGVMRKLQHRLLECLHAR